MEIEMCVRDLEGNFIKVKMMICSSCLLGKEGEGYELLQTIK
jgi:hypothetical protein